jgi:hypothetical protein
MVSNNAPSTVRSRSNSGSHCAASMVHNSPAAGPELMVTRRVLSAVPERRVVPAALVVQAVPAAESA